MILGIIKSLFFMTLFFLFIRFLNYIVRLFLFFKNRSVSNENKKEENSDSISSLNMIQCEKCKIYIAKSEAYFRSGKVYCKKEHSY